MSSERATQSHGSASWNATNRSPLLPAAGFNGVDGPSNATAFRAGERIERSARRKLIMSLKMLGTLAIAIYAAAASAAQTRFTQIGSVLPVLS